MASYLAQRLWHLLLYQQELRLKSRCEFIDSKKYNQGFYAHIYCIHDINDVSNHQWHEQMYVVNSPVQNDITFWGSMTDVCNSGKQYYILAYKSSWYLDLYKCMNILICMYLYNILQNKAYLYLELTSLERLFTAYRNFSQCKLPLWIHLE